MVMVLLFATLAGLVAATPAAAHKNGKWHSTNGNTAARITAEHCFNHGPYTFGSGYCGVRVTWTDIQSDGHCVYLRDARRNYERSCGTPVSKWFPSTYGLEICITGHNKCVPIDPDNY